MKVFLRGCFPVALSIADSSLSRMGVSQGSLWKRGKGRKPPLGKERTQLPLITGMFSPRLAHSPLQDRLGLGGTLENSVREKSSRYLFGHPMAVTLSD